MTIESATYISDLNPSYPGASDLKSEGDDHIRLLKSAVKATFPNVTGAVTATHTQINALVAGGFTTLSSTGNTVLGDATTDTLNVGAGGIVKDASGNTGFGLSPTSNYRVDVSGTIRSIGGDAAAGYGVRLLNAAQNGGGEVTAPAGVSGGIRIGSDAGPLTIFTNGVERARIDAAGNVGIGKSPSVKLDVNGVVAATTFVGGMSGNISQFTNDSGYITATGAAAAGSLTGNTLASNVVNSSLQTVGNLSALTVTAPIVGSVTGSAGSVAWTSVTGKPTVFSTVSMVTNFTGTDVGTGSYITDVSISASGNAITLTIARTYHTGGGGGGP